MLVQLLDDDHEVRTEWDCDEFDDTGPMLEALRDEIDRLRRLRRIRGHWHERDEVY